MIRTSQMTDSQFSEFLTTHSVSGGDRAAQQAAKSAEATAAGTAGQLAGNVGAERAQLTPFYRSEMNAQHAFTPQQNTELLSAAGVPIAAETSTAAGKAASQAAHTRNTSGYSAALDQAARQGQQAMGNVGLDVAKEDVLGAQKLRQEGAAGMAGLFGQDQNAMLKAMGQESEDINSEVNAGKSGWFQNTLDTINTLSQGYKNIFGPLSQGGGGGGGGGSNS